MQQICILGLGYVGLPTASIFASNGFRVFGVDSDPDVVRTLRAGSTHIEEPGLKTLVQAALGSGNLTIETAPHPADAFIICVPTPFTEDRRMDGSFVCAAAESLLSVVKKGNLVILESTVTPGTTRDLLLPILGRSGLQPGRDLFVAYCPERVLPGRVLKELLENDRVIGGIDSASAEKARELYGHVVEGEIAITDATSAELSKCMENTYRDVNIALANELAQVCLSLGCNPREVFPLANRHPRVNILSHGPGVGGHCIPVDPWFLVECLPANTRLIRTAREVNDSMPARVAGCIREIVNGIVKPKVTILGITYKSDVDDVRESPAMHVIELLRADGYGLGVYDPHVRRSKIELDGPTTAFEQSDCVVVLTDHSDFRFLDPRQIAELLRTRNLLDTRGVLDAARWAAAGFQVHLY